MPTPIDICGFPGYRIDEEGNGFSCRVPKSGAVGSQWKPLRRSVDSSNGYPYFRLRRDGRTFKKYVHQLVLEAFVGPCPEGMEACHFPDVTRTNCRVENLRWDTPQSNQADKIVHGTTNRGARQWKVKLTEADIPVILEIRREIPNASMEDIGILFGVGKTAISAIFRGDNWSWLTGIKPGDHATYGPDCTRRRARRLA